MNFPTTHPLFAGTQSGAYIKDTDVILVIDCDVPYVPCVAKPKSDAKIIHIDIDAVKQNMPLWGFPVDFFLQCDSSKTMPLLTQMISRKVTQEQRSIIRGRYQQLEKEHKRQREERNSLAESKAGQKPISMEWACRCVGEAIGEDTIVLEEPLNDNSAALRQILRTRAGTFFQSGGGSLGWGLGAAIGAKLASPDKTIVALVGDGSFVFGCPTAALWMAGACHAPFLCVIFNNSQYYAPKAAIRKAYGKDSYSEKTGLWPGVDILPSPEYARIAEACHAYGRVVEEPGELSSALKAALEQVRAGKAAVLDVRIERQ